MSKLEWTKLLSTKRERMPQSSSPNNHLIVRNEFESDYDRIVGSSSVRRLQDKAQVFPLQENDVVRTRLTHSIEVSALARSLGKAVGRQLEHKNIFTAEETDELSAILQVAGLIHDIGNPPFGHFGETVIRKWFTSWFGSNPILATHNIVFTEQEQNDFRYFDGNVQNLRIVTKLQTNNDIYGANFTYATLGTIMKYPWKSDSRPNEKEKFGFLKSEEKLANKIRTTLGLSENVRHPATYLLEAADDIIYLCDDIEDGVKKGCINWEKEYEIIKKNLAKNISISPALHQLFCQIEEKEVDKRMDSGEQEAARVRNFRNAVQSFLFKRSVENFLGLYEDIMSNDYTKVVGLELLDCEKPLIKELKNVTERNCFCNREVLTLELVGDKVISSLLDTFVPAFIECTGKDLSNTKTYAGKLFKLISPNFVYIATYTSNSGISEATSKAEQLDQLSIYERLLLITDFVSGMTDSYAVNLYQELNGIKHP